MSAPNIRVKLRDANVTNPLRSLEYDCSCGLDWCDHVKDMIESWRDGYRVAEAMALADQQPVMFRIPLIPTHALYVDTVLRVGAAGSRKVMMVRDTPDGDGTTETHIGSIVSGDGMMIVRSMIAGQLEAERRLQPGSCRSTSHGYKEERIAAARRDDKPWNQASEYSKLLYRKCLPCRQKFEAFMDGIDEYNETPMPVGDRKPVFIRKDF